jgi:hypothetical protein
MREADNTGKHLEKFEKELKDLEERVKARDKPKKILREFHESLLAASDFLSVFEVWILFFLHKNKSDLAFQILFLQPLIVRFGPPLQTGAESEIIVF